APFVATLFGDDSYYPKTTISDQASGIWGGVQTIEVYGHQDGSTVTRTAENNWTFTMPAYNAALSITYKDSPALAWTLGGSAMPNDTTITAYLGFTDNLLASLQTTASDNFRAALAASSTTLFVRHATTDPSVVMVLASGDIQVIGPGQCDIYAVFEGNDDYTYDSAYFHLNILAPDTLTLAAEGNGTVAIEGVIPFDTVFSNALTTQALFNQMTVVDNNGHSNMYGTWTFSTSSVDPSASYTFHNTQPGDDWLITPAIEVEAGTTYTISFDAKRASANNELFEVKAASANTADALSAGSLVVGNTNPPRQYSHYTGTFTPTEDGTYYVGIHAISDANKNGIYVKNLNITRAVTIPGVVITAQANTFRVLPGTELTVNATPAENNFVASWSNDAAVDSILGAKQTFTMPAENTTLTASFAQNPLLTLNAGQGGSVTLDGYTPAETTYDITIDGNTVTNVTFPYQTTVSLHNMLMQVYGANPVSINSFQSYSPSAANATITISEPFDGSRTISYYYDSIGAVKTGSKTITCTANHSDAVYPDGVTAGTTANTYRVLPGTQLSVTATPAEGSYLAQWSDQTEPVEGDARLGGSHPYTMPATPATLTATFNEIPVLTLASNNSEWGTVEMPLVTVPETLLTTINASGSFTSGSQTFDNVATVTFAGQTTYEWSVWMAQYGDGKSGTITLSAAEGVNVTGYKLYFDYASPYTITASSATLNLYCESSSRYVYYLGEMIGYEGISKIEVYGTVSAMPAGVLATEQENVYNVLPGTTVTVNATAADGYHISGWSNAAEVNSLTAASQTLTVSDDLTLTATFAQNPLLTLASNNSDWGTVALGA
ncbi:MAG: choice-of-anchor J domain-containing protein, partial [Clostridia bacterium]|nr:choice-of-anchor J domain-containing protein [Clostridia bacterium]